MLMPFGLDESSPGVLVKALKFLTINTTFQIWIEISSAEEKH